MRCSSQVQWLFEREFCTGLLSKYSRYRLFVEGNVKPKDIDNLIKQLELYKQNLS